MGYAYRIGVLAHCVRIVLSTPALRGAPAITKNRLTDARRFSLELLADKSGVVEQNEKSPYQDEKETETNW